MLGRTKVLVPVKVWSMAAPWSTPSPTIDRITQRSSAQSRTWGKRSLTGSPLRPPRRNSQGDCISGPAGFSSSNARGRSMGSGLPWSRVRRSLGSRMSIPEGPPCMKRKMTRRALGLKWGGRSASGFPEGEANRPDSSASSPARPRNPNPPAEARSMARLETGTWRFR